jgi:hypothetical protein
MLVSLMAWIFSEVSQYFGSDVGSANKCLRNSLPDPNKEPDEALCSPVLTTEAVEYELECAEKEFDLAYQRRARVLDRANVLLTVSSILLAATALFAQLPAAIDKSLGPEYAFFEGLAPLVLSSTLVLGTVSIIVCIWHLIELVGVKPTAVPERAEAISRNLAELERLKRRRILDLYLCVDTNTSNTLILFNESEFVSRHMRYGIALLTGSAITYIFERSYEVIAARLVVPAAIAILHPFGTVTGFAALLALVVWLRSRPRP